MKRKRNADGGHGRQKRFRHADQSPVATPPDVDHPVMQRLYPQVFTLRHYLLSRLPASSKNRCRRISQVGASIPGDEPGNDVALGRLLDSTLVGAFPTTEAETADVAVKSLDQAIESFTQQASEQSVGGTYQPGYFLQSEIVDFVIWLLFSRTTSHRPNHLLCHGFQRARGQNGQQNGVRQSIPGLTAQQSNFNVDTLKGPLWRRLHALLGQGGERIMMNLLVHCGIFCSVDGSAGNFYQLSGIPLSEIKPKATGVAGIPGDAGNAAARKAENRSPSEITFVRSRMLYAQSALNGRGGVRFGLRHIHVLNRHPNLKDELQTIHIMRYIFPRQFGLHNVFTSQVDVRETSMQFKDYTLREQEISQAMYRETAKKGEPVQAQARWKAHVPKRLRGDGVALVNRLRKLNHKCSYTELLRHYCPVEGLPLSPQPDWRRSPLQPSARSHATARLAGGDKGNETIPPQSQIVEQACFTDMACPTAHVSAFCRAVVARVVPNGLWGDEHNRRIIMYWIDRFIQLRRFESLTLHQVTQKVQISTLAWIRPPGWDASHNMAKTDFDKRKEVFLELVYWLFDSFLVPLVRSNFHVTESNVHRHRLFYFRHDVWRMLTEPSISDLKLRMFEELPTEQVTKVLSSRSLGFSKIRLLPKKVGVRMITNLRRKQQVRRNGVMTLGRSINAAVAPVFNAISYEKSLQPDRFGSSLFSVSDMFPKLASFRASLQDQGLSNAPLYFAKVDVQSCFDTIPQQRLLSMVEDLLALDEYHTGKHVELRSLGKLQRLQGQDAEPLPLKRYVPHGRAAGESAPFAQLVRDKFAGTKSNTIFVDTAVRRSETKDNLMQLLREHVERNLIKIGKTFYRQKAGIPQGSVLSSILCNFFYAELERDTLGFALGPNCCLLRLLDDFCLITASREHAERFVRVMHRGNSDYGVCVRAAKSLANFEVATDEGCRISKCVSDSVFPYCGVLIDMHTLEVSKSVERKSQAHVADSLTVDSSKVPGQTFHRRILNGFKIQLQAMYIDTSFNSVPTVLANLHTSFLDSAVRCFEYTRSLSQARPAHSQLLIKTVSSLIALAYVMLQRRSRSKASQNVEQVRSLVSRRQLQWLACKAFETTFQRRQTQHGVLLAWVKNSLAAARPSAAAERCMLEDARTWRAARGGCDG